MGCCGKAKRIIKGTVGHVVEKTTGIVVMKSPHTETRIQTCGDCEYHTCLNIREYLKQLLGNGVDVLRKLNQLEKLPMLPKQDIGKNIYCRICKCFVLGKARTDKEIEDMETYENCPKRFWKN